MKKKADPVWMTVKHDLKERMVMIVRLLLDLVFTAFIVGGLFFLSWLLHVGAAAGLINEQYVARFETTHFYASYTVYVITVLDFIYKLGVLMFAKESK